MRFTVTSKGPGNNLQKRNLDIRFNFVQRLIFPHALNFSSFLQLSPGALLFCHTKPSAIVRKYARIAHSANCPAKREKQLLCRNYVKYSSRRFHFIQLKRHLVSTSLACVCFCTCTMNQQYLTVHNGYTKRKPCCFGPEAHVTFRKKAVLRASFQDASKERPFYTSQEYYNNTRRRKISLDKGMLSIFLRCLLSFFTVQHYSSRNGTNMTLFCWLRNVIINESSFFISYFVTDSVANVYVCKLVNKIQNIKKKSIENICKHQHY